MGRFQMKGIEEGEEIIKISKVGLNIGFFTKSKIGFAKFIDPKLS